MKIKFSVLMIFFLAFSFSIVSAEEPPKMPTPEEFQKMKESGQIKNMSDIIKDKNLVADNAALENECFTYYKFGSIKMDLDVDKGIYQENDIVKAKVKVQNENAYPIVDGSIVVQIFRNNEKSFEHSDHQVDEFVALENINLSANETKDLEFEWKIPQGTKKDLYKMALFFQASKKYNLSGLYFVNNIYGALKSFEILSIKDEGAYIDRNNVVMDGTPLRLRDFARMHENGKLIKISFPLKNDTDKDISTSLKIELFSWDSSRKENIVKTEDRKYQIKKGSVEMVDIIYENLAEGTYQFRATLGTDVKSILNIRMPIKGFFPHVGFSGFNKFPLMPGEKTKIFSCYSNSTDGEGDGKIILTLQDKNKKELFKKEYSGKIDPYYALLSFDFEPKEPIYEAYVIVDAYGKDGKQLEHIVQKFESKKPANISTSTGLLTEEKSNIKNILLGAGVLLISIIFIFYLIRKRKNQGI